MICISPFKYIGSIRSQRYSPISTKWKLWYLAVFHKVHRYSTQGGKPNPRELAEDELKEIENMKKTPPKINKKDLAALKVEEDGIATEQRENEEKKKKKLYKIYLIK